ncbi:ankyrin repeat domain-containing protein [Actimicrobium sp. CCI2.3]|uniref:ankyrin repeat domain-containing protein n=1 Tax=Actimicrobium sp. CCI2.3 TaxID=3048616 RepID=UPI002AB4DB9B|nr:ankyrin repeat domain-containing protein [Actimicrobium sp. CCI2.3]MDY7576248.1 ankyrin repeat domain-containing protein [Actimicrobium sp. CCI2.3]MEB0020548.1 ankyrin repeat domain-containing protein [Actimicrobium sp. CCI2.3]
MNLNPADGNLHPNRSPDRPPIEQPASSAAAAADNPALAVPQEAQAQGARKRPAAVFQTEQRGMLVAAGDLDKLDDNGWAPLHHAIYRRDRKEVRRLLRLRANPDLATSVGMTPLMFAVQAGHCELIKMLLDTGRVQCNAIDTYGCTALHSAAKIGNTEIIDLLLKAGSAMEAVTPEGLNALHCATMFGHAGAVSMLMERSAGQLNIQASMLGWDALHIAAHQGNHEVVAALVAHAGVDVNRTTSSGNTALRMAAIEGHGLAVRALLDVPDIAPDARSELGESALHCAVRVGAEDVVVALVGARGVDVNAVTNEGESALHLAINADHLTIVDQLLASPHLDVNLATPSGMTALSMCTGLMENLPREEAALRLLAHPDIDPNGAIFLLDSTRVIDHFRSKAQAPSTMSEADFLVQELERWTCFKPSNGVSNRFLSSATNSLLGDKLHHQRSGESLSLVARRDHCVKDAAFRLTLALEQLLQFYGRCSKSARLVAQRLLAVAPREPTTAGAEPLPDDHYHNQFILDGIAYSRDEIEDMAFGRGRYALDAEIDQIAHANWAANVHQEGFLLRGRDILERLAQSSGATELTMDEAIAPVQRHIRALASDRDAQAQISLFLFQAASLQPDLTPQDLKQQVANWVVAQPEPQRARLQGAWRGAMIHLGLEQVLSQDGEVNEGGLITSAPRTLHLMQSYILQQSALPDRQVVALQLQDAVLERLVDIGSESRVCNTGCVQRLLDAAAGVDENLMAREPHDRAIFDEILHIGSVVNRAFDVHCKEGEQAIVTDEDQRNYDALSGEVRKDILRATTIDDLIRRRGWSRPKVETQLNAVLDGL